MKSCSRVLVFLLLLGTCFPLMANSKKDFTQSIKKEYDLNPEGLTAINNAYGTVEVLAWDRDRVRIEVIITVRAMTDSEAQTIFDRIRIDFSNSANEARAVTHISSSSSWWGGSYSKGDFTIDYKVHIPRTGSLQVENKYGDLRVDPFLGNANIEVKYGNFQLDGVGKDVQATLAYGNGKVVKARDVNLQLSYSKMQLDDVRNLTTTSKYSKTTLLRASTIKASSKYDNFNIGKVRDFTFEGNYNNLFLEDAETVSLFSKYTDIRIEKLSQRGQFDMQYGGATMHLLKGFGDLQLNGRYTNFKLSVDEDSSYQLEASGSYSGISYPPAMTVTTQSEDGQRLRVEAYTGTQHARSIIRANLNYGGLKVQR